MKRKKPTYPRFSFRCPEPLHSRVVSAAKAEKKKPAKFIRDILKKHTASAVV